VKAGNIASGVLYRSSTPFTNEINRANYVSDYLESQKITTVLNLADTKEKMQTYDMPPYSRTLWEGDNVILCPLVTDYLITYDNYYGVTPQKDRDVCNTLLSLRLYPCLMYYADIKDEAQLPNVDYAKAFSNYLLSHGMSSEQVDALIKVLTVTATCNH
jgi:hypothetical protein